MRVGDLELRGDHQDTLLPARRHERFRQLYHGIPVWGADVARQTEAGLTVSVFGQLYGDITIPSEPKLQPEQARDIIARLSGVDLGARVPQLVVLPLDGGDYALTYRDQAIGDDDASVFFIDAMDGSVRLRYGLFENQSAVVQGTGVLAEPEKISVRSISGTYTADDQLRPPAVMTFDMRGSLTGDLERAQRIDDAHDSQPGPGSVGHVDRRRQRGRPRLRRLHLRLLLQAVRPARAGRPQHPHHRIDARGPSAGHLHRVGRYVGQFYLNAFYCDSCGRDRLGMMVYGEGSGPAVVVSGGVRSAVRNFAGSLDVVAHELTHGVTAHSSNLLPLNEAGALNEAFSDMMGTSVEFFTRPASANYIMGDNLTSTFVPGFQRSLQDPLSLGTPDHYSIRRTDSADNGEVHNNSTIPSHAFYLAIEGGTNRTSKITVTGRRRREPGSDREGLLSRVHAVAAGQRDVRDGASGDDSGGSRPVRRRQRG